MGTGQVQRLGRLRERREGGRGGGGGEGRRKDGGERGAGVYPLPHPFLESA